MKKIIYKVLGYTGVYDPETDTVEDRQCVTEVQRPYTEANEEIAKMEAIPGTIEVTGEFEPEGDTATTDDVLNALLGVSV